MVRRTAPQKQMDEQAFPIKVIIQVPPDGLGRLLTDVRAWLIAQTGEHNFAQHGAGGRMGKAAVAFYFRDMDAPSRMLQVFPQLILADGIGSRWYTRPGQVTVWQPEDLDVCNLYNHTRAVDSMQQLFKGLSLTNAAGNLEPGNVYPDQVAPIIRHGDDGFELIKARWGMPSPPSVLKTARDPGVTNVRNTRSPHWRGWLGPAHRCLVPLTSFAEPRGKGQGNQWFAATEDVPMFFAGIETRGWKSMRKVKDGETTDDLFAFLTTEPNAEVRPVHPKAMPVILTDRADWETWMTAPAEIALQLQRPLPDGALRLVDEAH